MNHKCTLALKCIINKKLNRTENNQDIREPKRYIDYHSTDIHSILLLY